MTSEARQWYWANTGKQGLHTALPQCLMRGSGTCFPGPVRCLAQTFFGLCPRRKRKRDMKIGQPSHFALSAILGVVFLFCLLVAPDNFSSVKADEPAGIWRSLFNGQDFTGWTPKIRGYPAGENFANTFRVADGMLQVRYDGYDKFDRRFGHLFFAEEFSHYRLRLEYRFVGQQANGGEGWATRNSGVMVHGERPETMGVEQDFPTSIEVQILGGDGKTPRTTGNLCTPGTNVVMNDQLVTRHCNNSASQTFHGEQWVKLEIEVRGNEVIRHFINGENVLEYQQPQYDPKDPHGLELSTAAGGLMLSKGTISLQSESHPCDFRNIEIMVIEP